MSTGNPAPPDRLRRMFDRIAPVYDPMNLLISGLQEPRWRRRVVQATGLEPGMRALDVACGTGKLTADLQRAVQPGGSAVGVDVAERMLERAVARAGASPGPTFVLGDALALPMADDSFDAATIAFGMRNLAGYERGFREMARVVRPGGRVVCLETSLPAGRSGRIVAGWFAHVVPRIGRIVGQGQAYGYLVRSTREYPGPERIAAVMRRAGLEQVEWFGMSAGIVTVHAGRVPV